MSSRLPAFDVLVGMARHDPEGLERLRRSLTDAVIERASGDLQRQRLKGLQFRVDMERRRAATPMAATVRIWSMMCDSLVELHRSLCAAGAPLEPCAEAPEHGAARTGAACTGAARTGAARAAAPVIPLRPVLD